MSDGNTPLHIAVQNQDIEIIKILLDSGSDVNAKNAAGQTPLHLAVQTANKEIISLLASNDKNFKANTALIPTVVEKTWRSDDTVGTENAKTGRFSAIIIFIIIFAVCFFIGHLVSIQNKVCQHDMDESQQVDSEPINYLQLQHLQHKTPTVELPANASPSLQRMTNKAISDYDTNNAVTRRPDY